MGRQIQIATTQADEAMLLDFLRNTAEVRIFESFAPSTDELWVDNFSQELDSHRTYHIWNTKFPFGFEYGHTTDPLADRQYFIENGSAAPIIEIDRSNVRQHEYGRVYWAKYFSAPEGLSYDIDEFSQWFNSIVRRIKKNSAGQLKDSLTTYFLPDAWHVHCHSPYDLPLT